MKPAVTDQNDTGEDISSNKNEAAEKSDAAETSNPWPYRIRLTPDTLRWDSLKISPSKEFTEHILQLLPESSLATLNAWHPVEVSIYDVDTHEIYKVNLAKKEAFWFEPFPDVGQRKENSSVRNATTVELSNSEARQKDFSYSLQPFRHIVKKRSLGYDQEIGLHWFTGETVNRMEFSVLHVPRFQLHDWRQSGRLIRGSR